MNNFQLILDTTPPIVVIYAPQYILNGHYLEFRVVSNEVIDKGRYEVKVYDNGLNEYMLNLSWNDEYQEFVGLIDTYNFVNGIAKIEVTLFDEVHNSSKAEKIFTVLKNDLYHIDLKIERMDNHLSMLNCENRLFFLIIENQIHYKELVNLINIKTQNNSIRFKVGDDDN